MHLALADPEARKEESHGGLSKSPLISAWGLSRPPPALPSRGVKGSGGETVLKLKVFWQSCAEFVLAYFVFFDIFIMSTCCIWFVVSKRN